MNAQSSRIVASASVSRAASNVLIDAALKAAAEAGFETAVAIVDAGGALKAFSRSDSAAFLTSEVALNKAWTAASYGYPTHVWNDYIANPKIAPLANLPRMMPVGGGYPLIENGRIVGGIGISGGSYAQDQDVAVAAIRAAGFDVPE